MMTIISAFRTRLLIFFSLFLGLSTMGGCGNGSPAVPTEEAARTALDTALKAWRDGKKPGDLSGVDPPLMVHDTPWSKGQLLASYQILSEDQTPTPDKQFTVRLSLAKPNRTEDVHYHVLGVSPLMVFRDEDYQRNINMENGPSLQKTGGRADRRK